jgi:dTDP-4-amino-4,6-dideoxygalactose transaminase
MLMTDEAELAERLRLLRSHGMTTLTWDRHRGHASSYDVVAAGFNYRLDELRAAIGLVQLGRLLEENDRRRRASARYRGALHATAGIVMPFDNANALEASSHHLAVVLLPAGSDRDAIRARLQAEGIQTSVHYPPIHRFSHYAALPQRALPKTDDVAARLVTLPLFGGIEDAQVDLVIDQLLRALDGVGLTGKARETTR